MFERHRERLERAVRANAERAAWSPWIQSPSRRHHPPGAKEAGRSAYFAHLDRDFELGQPGVRGWIGHETSPWTGDPLGVRYPQMDVDQLFQGVHAAWRAWRRATPEARVGVCMEMLDRWHQQTWENAFATQHTTGQGFLLAFAGSGASALDRGLEALAAAWSCMSTVPGEATYTRRFGRGEPVTLHKRYKLQPVGVATVLSCGSYPAWNAYPAILANLATGNPVVLKPHPDTILPMAIAVRTARQVLADAGFDPNVLTLCADSWDAPVATQLFDRSAIIDFTGGQRFGAWIEATYPRLQVYTETAGCNAVVLDSAPDLEPVLAALAHSLCLFSGQMCTAPQNLWIPETGVRDAHGLHAVEHVVERLSAHIDALASVDLCGTLHSPRTLDEIAALATQGTVLRASAPLVSTDWPDARTASPLLIRPHDRSVAQREHFGPMALVQTAPTRDACLAHAAHDAQTHGAIASYAYTDDADWIPAIQDAFWDAGASVGINLVRQRPINFTAAFSDFHVTGLNPAGCASLTDPAFVARRFRVVQSKVELPCPEPKTSGS
jgi:phenylacetic acid degradation protein paaN